MGSRPYSASDAKKTRRHPAGRDSVAVAAVAKVRAPWVIRIGRYALSAAAPCWFAATVAFPADGSERIAAAMTSSCSPQSAVLSDLGVVRQAHNAMYATSGWYDELTARVEAIAAEHPSDIFVQRERDSWIFRVPSRRKELLLQRELDYKKARTPEAAYLLGRVQLLGRAPSNRSFLERAVVEFPSFAPLQLLYAAAIRDSSGRPGTSAEVQQVERYLSLCPGSAEGIEFLRGWAPSREHEKKLEDLRRHIDSLQGPAALPYIRAYGNGAFSILPSGTHGRVRSDISRWLAQTLSNSAGLALGELEIIAQVFRSIGDESGELRANDLIVAHSPQSVAARNAIERKWEIVDKAMTPSSHSGDQENLKKRLLRTELLLDMLPHSPELHLRRFLIAREIDETPDTDVLRFGVALRDVLRAPPRVAPFNPVPQLLIANEFAARRIGLENLPDLVEEGVDAIGHLKAQADPMFQRGGEGKLRFLAELDAQLVLAWSLLAEDAVRKHDVATAMLHRKSAQAVLREMAGVEKSDQRYPIHLSALGRYLRCVGEIELSMGNRRGAREALVSARYWEARSSPGAFRTKRSRIDELSLILGAGRTPDDGGREPDDGKAGGSAWTHVSLQFPEVNLDDVLGSTFSTSSWRGSVVLVSYWATWCGPCLSELRELEKLRKRYGPGDKVHFQSINLDEDEGTVRGFVNRNGISVPVGMGARLADRLPWATAGIVPQTLIVDRRGVVRYRAIGFSLPDRWAAGAEEFISELIGEASD